MSVSIIWDNEAHTIVRCIYEGHITEQDYYTAIDKTAELLQTVPHTVHSINHRQKVLSLPRNLTQIMRYAQNKLPANHGVQVIIGAQYFTKVMVNVGSVIAPHLVNNVFFAKTLDEAHAIIVQQEEKTKAK